MKTNVIGLENQNVKFYLNAPPNSPIWGSAEDMTRWLEWWHENGEHVAHKPDGVLAPRWSEFMGQVFIDSASDRNLVQVEMRRGKEKKVKV